MYTNTGSLGNVRVTDVYLWIRNLKLNGIAKTFWKMFMSGKLKLIDFI